MIRLGLCCLFKEEPIKFRTTTAASVLKLSKRDRLVKLSALCLHNALSLKQALAYCANNHIGSFRVLSQILPLKTHPQAGYAVNYLPDGDEIIRIFQSCKTFAKENNIRTGFHPDQFILLSSPDDGVTERSIQDLDYQAEVSEWIGADTINIHGGGAYGDKTAALARVVQNLSRLPERVRTRLTLENDDKVYTPADLLPLCRDNEIPFV